jgi:hypothetical protein
MSMTSLSLLDAEDEAFLDGLLDDGDGGNSPYSPTSPTSPTSPQNYSPQNYHRHPNEDDEEDGFVAAWDLPADM